jgi:hypothetical protein
LAPYGALAAELNFCNKGTIGMRQFNAAKADFLRYAGALIKRFRQWLKAGDR